MIRMKANQKRQRVLVPNNYPYSSKIARNKPDLGYIIPCPFLADPKNFGLSYYNEDGDNAARLEGLVRGLAAYTSNNNSNEAKKNGRFQFVGAKWL